MASSNNNVPEKDCEDDLDIVDGLPRWITGCFGKSKRNSNDNSSEDEITFAKEDGNGNISSSENTRRISRKKSAEYYYPMDNIEYNGLAIIFAHKYFALKNKKRPGVDIDLKVLTRCFNRLNFKVEVYRDLTKDEVLNRISIVSKMNFKNYGCLAVVVSSHGNGQSLETINGSYPCSALWKPFYPDACPGLVDKPKLFFIQSCRGEKFDSGLMLVKDLSIFDSRTDNEFDNALKNALPAASTENTPLESVDIDKSYDYNLDDIHVPDFLMFFSTMKDHYSFTNHDLGSYFITFLARVLYNDGFDQPLTTCLTAVNRMMAVDFQSRNRLKPEFDKKKQISCLEHTLTKVLQFNDLKSK